MVRVVITIKPKQKYSETGILGLGHYCTDNHRCITDVKYINKCGS